MEVFSLWGLNGQTNEETTRLGDKTFFLIGDGRYRSSALSGWIVYVLYYIMDIGHGM